jgi:hypothetical protein
VFEGTEEHRVFSKGNPLPVKKVDAIDSCLGERSPDDVFDPQDIIDGIVLGDGSVHKASNDLIYLCVGALDGDYFNSEVASYLTRHRPGLSDVAWEVKTTITKEELPRTFNRLIPERFFGADYSKKRSFLKGLFSANGDVTNSHASKQSRVCLRQTSKTMVYQVQQMLSSLGIASYITTDKEKRNEFSNGTYVMKESYKLNISDSKSIEIFFSDVGFIQAYKSPLYQGVQRARNWSRITNVESIGVMDVFDLMVEAEEHSYWTGGLLVSNCTEIVSDTDSDCCNLGSINLGRIGSKEELERVTRIATRFLYLGTFHGWLPS